MIGAEGVMTTIRVEMRRWLSERSARIRLAVLRQRPWGAWWDTRTRCVARRGSLSMAMQYRRDYVRGVRGLDLP